MNCDVNSLMAAAATYKSIPNGMRGPVMIALMSSWAGCVVVPPPPAPPVIPFSFSPSVGGFPWRDKNGNYNTTLAIFQATADMGSVFYIDLSNHGLTSIVGLGSLPSLQVFYAQNNSLTTLDLSGNPALVTFLCYNNSLSSLNIGTSTNLTTLFLYQNLALSDFTLNGFSSLLTFNGRLCGLTTAKVNRMLDGLNIYGLHNGSCQLDSQTPAAPPSTGPPDGVFASASLTGKGWYITTDSP